MKVISERKFVKDKIAYWRSVRKDHPCCIALEGVDEETITAVELGEKITLFGRLPNYCTECGKETWDLVEMGAIADNESAEANLCIDCLQAAVNLFCKTRAKP